MSRRGALAEALLVLALGPILVGTLIPIMNGPLADQRPAGFLWLGLAGLAWLLAVRVAPRVPDSPALLLTLVAGAIALRVAVLAGDPELSDDIQRYVWEGGLVAEGTSPYAFAPDDPRLEEHRARWAGVYAAMNNTEVSAAYPPLTQAFHALVVSAAGGPGPAEGERARRALRLATTVCDLFVLAVLVVLVRKRGRPLACLVAWAWCPLVALEYAGSAHFDSLGILLLMGALLLLHESADPARTERDPRVAARRNTGVGLLALGGLVKLLPLAVLPFAVRTCRSRGRMLSVAASVLLLGLAPLLFLEGGLGGLGSGFSEYALRWESYNVLFRWIEAPVDQLLDRDGTFLDARRVARGMAFAAWCGVGLWLWRTRADATRAAAVLLAAFLLLTPTVHPWYLTWIVPFLVLEASLAWTLFVALAPLLYWPLTDWAQRGQWIEPRWLWPVISVPLLGLIVLEELRRRGARA